MGGYDNYCAICGTRVGQPTWDDDEGDEYGYERSILWMSDVRVISENPEAMSMDKLFISEPAEYDDYGSFDVEPGDHPNFPTRAQISYNKGWPGDAPLFTSGQLGKGESVDEEVLYHTWKELVDAPGGLSQCLTNVAYGTDTDAQYWPTNRGEESFATNPVDIPQLQGYYKNLPLLTHSDARSQGHRVTNEPQLIKDPLARLPPELLLSIVVILPMVSVNCLRASSPAVARLELNNGFWKQNLHHDMPWLFDMPDRGNEEPDWAKCYEDLLARSHDGGPAQILGLVNRRRIWGACDQVASLYARRKATKDENRKRSQVSLLTHAMSTPMRRLTSPKAKTEISALPLLNQVSDIDHGGCSFSTFWSSKGALSGLGFQRAGSTQRREMDTTGSCNQFAVRDEVEIKNNDWIRGFIVTSCISTEHGEDKSGRKVVRLQVLFIRGKPIQLGQSNGDLVLIHAENDRHLVALLAQWSPDGPISGLSLLQVSVSEESPQAAQLARIQAGKPESISEIGSRLWKDHLPPAEMTLSEEKLGYWTTDSDLAPMEALVFGQDEDELSAITGFSGDIQFGAFEVRYRNRPPKCIGPRPLTMKSLPIDGLAGERIIKLVLGSCQPNARSETIYSSTEEKSLRGIYCNWSGRSSPKTNLVYLAGLFVASPSPPPLPTGPQDTTSHGNPHWWEPCPPPPTWTPSVPLHGAHETPSTRFRRGTTYPTPSASTTWLDCTTRPVRRVRLHHAHRTRYLPFTPISIVLEYTDVSIASAGPTRLTIPTDTEGENNSPWCWCHLDSRLPESESQLGKMPHYYSDQEWIIEGGANLESCRLWVGDGGGPLKGMQFVSAGGNESPRWGLCEGAHTVVISFTENPGKANGDNKAVGLKIFLDSNGRPVTYPDTVIVGIQALVQSSVRRNSVALGDLYLEDFLAYE
ncbi:hypothetical protein BDW62DRAFT_203647 [Aspergillus aurantiobrunneus]